MGKELNVQLPEKFKPFCTSTARYCVAWGGRASGKTYSFAIIFLLKALQSKVKILAVREIQSSIKESVYDTLIVAMDIMGARDLFDCTHNCITCKVTGSTFIFSGLYRNVESIKSIPNINYVWCAEADKISEESFQLLFPTIREQGSQIFIEFNPSYEDDAAYKRFVANTVPDSLVVNVNWMDNPFVSETILKEKDVDFATRPEDAEWIWNGKLKRAGAQVWSPPFDKAIHVREFDLKEIKDYKIFHALDPHTSFYSAAIWFAAWKVGDRFYKWIFDEWPRHHDVNADYRDIRNTMHYTGDVKDLAKAFFAKETGLTVTQRYIDTRFAKGFGSTQSNLVNKTLGLVESFVKPENGGILFLMPTEAHIDEAKDKIKSDMRHNLMAERSAINEPCFYVSAKCTNVIRSLTMHRYEENSEKQLETYKDHSDCVRIGWAGFNEYRWPSKPKYNPQSPSGSWMS